MRPAFVIGILFILLTTVFMLGSLHGSQRYMEEKATLNGKVKTLEGIIEKSKKLHEAEQAKLIDKVKESNENHEKSLSVISDSFNSRMLKSEERAILYKRKAELGESQCRDLASYTAELDRSIEEGRDVVRQLAATLRKRDVDLITVSEYFTNDRNFLNE